jgi:F-type H+-transporting ATPase subunit a
MAAGQSDIFHHIRDSHVFELPWGTEIPVPFGISKFMLLQVVAGLLTVLIFQGLAKRIASGEPARGRWWNFWELLAVFVRDEVVRPSVGTGHHDHDDEGHHSGDGSHDAVAVQVGHPADKYLPFVWTVFFFILFNNLLGAIPWLGTATGHLCVTGALALTTFAYVVKCGTEESGVVGFWKSIAPSMDIPGIIGPPVKLMIWVIEFAGLLIKHLVLAIRLFANIMAGHTVLAVILGFIAQAAAADQSWIFYMVAPASVFGQVAIGLLELFVAFLQAYVFSMLASLFIGMAVHPH